MKSEFLQTGDAGFITFEFDRTIDRSQIEEMAQIVETAMETHDELRLLLELRSTIEFEVNAVLSAKGLITSLKSI